MALYGLNLANWWRIILRRKWMILYIFLAVFVSTVFFTNRLSPVYLSQATIKAEEVKIIGKFHRWEEWSDIKTTAQFINRFRVMDSELERSVSESKMDRGLDTVRHRLEESEENIEIEKVEDSNIVEIRTRAPTPEQAVELANTVTQAYVALIIEEKLKKVRFLRQSIEKRLMTVKTRLDKSEQALNDFKEREGNITLEKKEAEERLADLELELSAFLQRYSEESPTVKELRSQIEAVQDQLSALAGKELELERLTRNFEYNQRKYVELKELAIEIEISEEVEKPNVSIVEPATVPQFPIWPNKAVNGFAGALVGLMVGISFAFAMESLQTSLGTIEEVESFMELPVLGVIPYLAVEEEKKKFWQWLRYRKRPDKLSRLREQLIIHYSPQSPAAESYRSLRTSIQSAALEKGAKALLVTSTGPGEGKSITAANLAIIAVQAGHRVLLVDGDLRRPILYKLFDLKREPGLADCLVGTTKWEDSLRTIVDILVKTKEWEDVLRIPGLDNLKIITCGHPALNPAELLGSKETKPLPEELKANFDLILFDSPPVLPIADASILASKLDGVILIYQTGMVVRDALRRAKEQLESAGAHIKGIVLNNTARELEAYPPYPYYRYKYDYEEKKKEESEVT